MEPISNFKRLRQIVGVLKAHKAYKGISAKNLPLILSDLGPAFVKLGQIASMQPDILPQEYCEELAVLRTNIMPLNFELLKSLLMDEFKDIDSIFSFIEPEPLGAASIAQVHRATLADGRHVVIKVQRPGIYATMQLDISLLKKASRLIKIGLKTGGEIDFITVLDEMWTAAKQEMDFLIEAQNLKEFYENNLNIRYISCPKVIEEYSTSRILVMEYIDGCFVDNVEYLSANGYDLEEIALKLANNYTRQVLKDGFFHADPHFGNIIIRGGQIVWIDLGMMGRLPARERELFSSAVSAIASGDTFTLKDILLSIGVYTVQIDHVRLTEDINIMLNKYGAMDFSKMDMKTLFDDLLWILKRHKIALPKGISMLGRGMATMQSTLRNLSVEINLIEIIINYMSDDILSGSNIKKEIKNAAKSGYFSYKKLLVLPTQISDLISQLNKGAVRINTEYSFSPDSHKKLTNIVNRLIAGMVCASLILGSFGVLIAGIGPKLIGIPVMGIIGLSAALAVIVFLLVKR